MIELIQTNPYVTKWIIAVSLTLFVATIILLPFLITIIPEDYFNHPHRKPDGFKEKHPIKRLVLIILKNILGYTLIFIGVLMLVLPGQGILTILAGLILIDFSNKYRIERWLVSRPRVLVTMNWFRAHARKKPLLIK